MKALNKITVLRSALAGLLLAAAIGSCGKATDTAGGEELQIDSNTNWLMRCDADDQCSGSLRCYCGQCSRPCSDSNECSLLAGAECASSGGAVCTDQPSAGGLCVLGCSNDAGCAQDFTCTDNQCVPKPCTGGYQSLDDVYRMIANDVAQLDLDDATFARYVSLGNRWSYGACGRTLIAEREGLSKLLNSLSRSPVVTSPAPIDADLTLYRLDLRDYDWDRSIQLGGVVYVDGWEALVAENPFAVPMVGDDADDAVADTSARVPVMFANSLIATATQPDVYYAMLGVPATYGELLADLGLDAAEPGIRAGYVERPEIIATHRSLGVRSGYLWDLGVVTGPAGALFADPLQDPAGERQLMFSLPNGLQGFAYMSAAGLLMNDSDLFLDTSQSNFRAIVPRTPLRQHSPKPSVHDEVADYVASNPGVFSPEARAAIAAAYPGQEAILALIESDYDTFTRRALEAASVDLRLPEPITTAFDEYDRDMAIEDVAGELMLPKEELEDNLALLDPAFAVLEGGFMDRDDFAALFADAFCTLSAVNDNVPEPGWCR